MNIIEEENYVSFESAKLLKDKGFDVPCIGFYTPEKELHLTLLGECNSMWKDESISAPTLQRAMKWLREEKNTAINIWFDGEIWSSEIGYINTGDGNFTLIGHFKTYEDAAEAAIKYCLENLIKA